MTSDAIKRRIKALRALTTEKGCTEAEALAAAAKAAALMRDYGVSETDLIMDQRSVRRKSEGHSVRDDLWRRIADFTNCACILNFDGDKPVRTYVGQTPGPEVATYLYVVLDRAIDRAVAEFKAGVYYRRRRSTKTKRAAVHEFTYAMVLRLCVRLRELFAASISADAWNAASAALAERFPNSVAVVKRAHPKTGSTDAFYSGFAAGGGVALSHGVEADAGGLKMIGGAA